MTGAERTPQASRFPEASDDQLATDRILTIQLPTDVDGEPLPADALALVLELVADTLPATSRVGELLASLAAAIDAGEQLDTTDLRERVQQRLEAQLTARWPRVIEEHRRDRKRRSYSYVQARAEIAKYVDRPPRGWEARVDRLEADGLPWFVLADAIHDEFTGPDPSIDAVIRTCRRTLRRMRDRAERET